MSSLFAICRMTFSVHRPFDVEACQCVRGYRSSNAYTHNAE